MASMLHEFTLDLVRLAMKVGKGYVIPMGPKNLVAVVTDLGVVGNDLLNTGMLEHFEFAAAKVAPADGDVIESLDDLIEGEVRAANLHAVRRRVEVGMSALEALNRL
jgi:uncharacterized protein YunC (DUF1805 family)